MKPGLKIKNQKSVRIQLSAKALISIPGTSKREGEKRKTEEGRRRRRRREGRWL